MVDSTKYVLLDVETNGLSAEKYDLLSISIYKPDDQKTYNRFLPLEKNEDLFQQEINGITKDMLVGAKPLNQREVDDVILEFDLKNRTILTYGSIDQNFIKKYFQDHSLKGIAWFNFYNFKQKIFSSSFSNAEISKDNLCKIFEIENVTETHSGLNDCILEWKLFQKMDGKNLIVIGTDVFFMNEKYTVPVSYLMKFPNLKKHLSSILPDFYYKYEIILSVPCSRVAFSTTAINGAGMLLEHCITSELQAERFNDDGFLLQNKQNLKYIGTLPQKHEAIALKFNKDGTISAINSNYESLVKELNSKLEFIKNEIAPLLKYMKDNIFKGKIFTQELVVNQKDNILALCDLSDENAVLEIKAYSDFDIDKIKYQLYYEANGRNCYILFYDYDSEKIHLARMLNCDENEYQIFFQKYKNDNIELEKNKLNNTKYFEQKLELLKYVGKKSKAFNIFRCLECDRKFRAKIPSKYSNFYYEIECPYCNPSVQIREWDWAENDGMKRLVMEQVLKQKNMILQNWINPWEVYAQCKTCGKIIRFSYRDLKKILPHCEK